MRARLTYVPLGVADEFGDFIIARNEEVMGAVRAKTRDYSMLSLVKTLYALRGGPATFTDLYSMSKIRMKRSFLNYLHLCIDYGFVERVRSGTYAIYTITDKGRAMLQLMHKDN